MPKTFVSDQDRRSFITPTYAFGDRRTAEACAAERGWNTMDDAFNLFSVGNTTYQPRSTTELDTGLLTADRSFRGADRPQFLTIRRADAAKPMPSGVSNTCLLVEGPREFYRYIHQTAKLPPYYFRFASSDFPCYAVWGREASAPPFGNSLFEEDGCRVFVGRSGRGVIYGRAPKFERDLSIIGYDMYLALVEFSVLDRDRNKDGVIRWTTRVIHSRNHEPTKAPELYSLDPQRFDPLWQNLAQRALEGFVETSASVAKASEADLARFVDQMKKAEADRRAPHGASFHGRIETMGWENALRSVEEPWQLEAVVRQFSGSSQFCDMPQYDGARYNRVDNMLKQHACTDARRDALHGMIESFVAPRDGLWNYVGG